MAEEKPPLKELTMNFQRACPLATLSQEVSLLRIPVTAGGITKIRWNSGSVVRLGGLEPPTKSLGNSCSFHLSYSRTGQGSIPGAAGETAPVAR
jgi:hypothetical protein